MQPPADADQARRARAALHRRRPPVRHLRLALDPQRLPGGRGRRRARAAADRRPGAHRPQRGHGGHAAVRRTSSPSGARLCRRARSRCRSRRRRGRRSSAPWWTSCPAAWFSSRRWPTSAWRRPGARPDTATEELRSPEGEAEQPMHLVRYDGGDGPRVGVRQEDWITPVTGVRSMAELLAMQTDELRSTVESASGQPVPVASVRQLVPLDGRGEVWCAGVTYERSRGARMEESSEQSVYDRVYYRRPARAVPRSRRPGGWSPTASRSGSAPTPAHDVPEPELAVVVNAHGEIVGYTVCNDMSSRSIEGENPLYIPQAKLFAGGCALADGHPAGLGGRRTRRDLAITLVVAPRRRRRLRGEHVAPPQLARALAGPGRTYLCARQRLPRRRDAGHRHRDRPGAGLHAAPRATREIDDRARSARSTNPVAEAGKEPFRVAGGRPDGWEEKRDRHRWPVMGVSIVAGEESDRRDADHHCRDARSSPPSGRSTRLPRGRGRRRV